MAGQQEGGGVALHLGRDPSALNTRDLPAGNMADRSKGRNPPCEPIEGARSAMDSLPGDGRASVGRSGLTAAAALVLLA